MGPERDPEGIEIEFLHRTGVINRRNVVEIGCGDGRLTWRYAPFAASTVAVDPDLDRLIETGNTQPDTIPTPTAFAQADAQMLPFPDASFNCAILAWSL